MNQHTQDRIDYITNNLLADTAFKDNFDAPQTLPERMAYYHTPGVSIAVINDFQIEWAQGFGLKDARYPNKVTTETLFQAGSISKPVFALGVMRLVQEGKLSLDEDVNNYLVSWRVPANQGWQPKITLRQLLSHTAGLTVHGFPGYQASESLPTVPQVLNGEAPANTGKVEVNILPGMQSRYSGGGTTVAQQLVVDLLKKPFPQIMRELVLAPLGLTNSTYQQPLPKRWQKSAATAHPWKGIPLKGRFHTYPEMAAAGLWTTATDLAKVGVEFLNVLHERNTHKLLTKETIDMMLSPQLADQKSGEGDFAGLGFFCKRTDAAFYFGHGGWDEGFVADMRICKDTGKGAVVMLNSNEGHPLLAEILRAIAIAYEWPDALPKEKTPIALANASDYTGLYLTKIGMQFQVDFVDDKLTLQYGEQPPLPLLPSSDVEFFTRPINAQIRFEKNGKAAIVSLAITQENKQIKADKQIDIS